MRDVVSIAFLLASLASITLAPVGAAHADWRDPIAGANGMLPTGFEQGDALLTVHPAPRRDSGSREDGASFSRWSQPLVDRPP